MRNRWCFSVRYSDVAVGLSLWSPMLLVGTAATAGERIRFEAPPAWVEVAGDSRVLADTTTLLPYLEVDHRIEGATVTSYVDRALRLQTPAAVSQAGTIQLRWQPSQGDLIVHRVVILRGGTSIDLLAKGTGFTTLRREAQLESRAMDGILTATMQAEGLQQGDVLRVSYTITRNDPTLKGRVQIAEPLVAQPARIGSATMSFRWPDRSGVVYRVRGAGIEPSISNKGGATDLAIAMPVAKQPDMPNDAPIRYRAPPIVEVSSFKSWADVASVMAPLYSTEGAIAAGSPLASEVARIAAASANPKEQAALAVKLVQSQVRYQLMGMETGNYVPQSPSSTWSLRYGDCKAKTLLLLAVMRELGIDAEPVLANIGVGDVIADRLPSALAFNHVLVRARVGGVVLWLDGTDMGTEFADLADVPNLGWVLPLRSEGAQLERLMPTVPARANETTLLRIDATTGRNRFSRFTQTMTVRGPFAQQLRQMRAGETKEQLEAFALNVIGKHVKDPVLASTTIDYDEGTATTKLTIVGAGLFPWKLDKNVWALALDDTVGTVKFEPNRTRAEWRDIPVATGSPRRSSETFEVVLPGSGIGYRLVGETPVKASIGGRTIIRNATLATGVAQGRVEMLASGREIAPDQIAAERAGIARLSATPLLVTAAPDASPAWLDAEAAAKEGRTAKVVEAFDASIASKPDDTRRIMMKGWYLRTIFDWQGALAAMTLAVTRDASAANFLERAETYFALGDLKRALSDAQAAVDREPANVNAVALLATLMGRNADDAGGIAVLAEKIATGGRDKARYLNIRALLLADQGKFSAAMDDANAAVAEDPNNAAALNGRCWLKATQNVQLDTALTDCSTAIELTRDVSTPLDSRALVFFRLGRYEQARLDLDRALQQKPEAAASLFLRALVRQKLGDDRGAALDLRGARLLRPSLEASYARYGLKAA